MAVETIPPIGMNDNGILGHARASEPAYREGAMAKTIESRTAKLPSDWFLWAAGGATLASMALQAVGVANVFRLRNVIKMRVPPTPPSAFIGLWAHTFLLLGIYNKIAKVAGSDRALR